MYYFKRKIILIKIKLNPNLEILNELNYPQTNSIFNSF